MTIQSLSKETCHLLKSTQVITSVSSVVKELVENSLDAGANNIEVRLENWGLDRIEVRDNGHGVKSDEVPSMVLPHTTSKIRDFSDLETLTSYGFRGEALASLCAVSSLSIMSKTKSDPVATLFEFNYNREVSKKSPLAAKVGTIVIATNLFANFPVRRNFYKDGNKKKDELKKVERTIAGVCLANIGVKVCLYHNKSSIFNKPACPDLLRAAGSVFGQPAASQMKLVERRVSPALSLSLVIPQKFGGMLAQFGRTTADRTFVLVNKRLVDLKPVEKLVKKLFSEAASSETEKFPTCVVSIQVEGENQKTMDVNLEPNKQKVGLGCMESVLVSLEELIKEEYGLLENNTEESLVADNGDSVSEASRPARSAWFDAAPGGTHFDAGRLNLDEQENREPNQLGRAGKSGAEGTAAVYCYEMQQSSEQQAEKVSDKETSMDLEVQFTSPELMDTEQAEPRLRPPSSAWFNAASVDSQAVGLDAGGVNPDGSETREPKRLGEGSETGGRAVYCYEMEGNLYQQGEKLAAKKASHDFPDGELLASGGVGTARSIFDINDEETKENVGVVPRSSELPGLDAVYLNRLKDSSDTLNQIDKIYDEIASLEDKPSKRSPFIEYEALEDIEDIESSDKRHIESSDKRPESEASGPQPTRFDVVYNSFHSTPNELFAKQREDSASVSRIASCFLPHKGQVEREPSNVDQTTVADLRPVHNTNRSELVQKNPQGVAKRKYNPEESVVRIDEFIAKKLKARKGGLSDRTLDNMANSQGTPVVRAGGNQLNREVRQIKFDLNQCLPNKGDSEVSSDSEWQIIGQLPTHKLWMFCEDQEIHILNHNRLQEVALYHRMLNNHCINYTPTEPLVLYPGGKLSAELAKVAASLSKSGQPPHITDKRLVFNGIGLMCQPDYNQPGSVVLKLVGRHKQLIYFGVEDIEQILECIQANPAVELKDCRPARVKEFLMSEVVRMMRQSPIAGLDRPDVNGLLNFRQTTKTWECLHRKPISQCLYTLETGEDSDCDEEPDTDASETENSHENKE